MTLNMHPFRFEFDIYLAGPFFNDQQRLTMDLALASLRNLGYKVFNPREHGPIIVNVPPAERTPEMLDAIVKHNIEGLEKSFAVFACIDDRDTGTAWEMGWASSAQSPIVSFSGFGHGANVMLARTVKAHLPSIDAMVAYARGCSPAFNRGRSDLFPKQPTAAGVTTE